MSVARLRQIWAEGAARVEVFPPLAPDNLLVCLGRGSLPLVWPGHKRRNGVVEEHGACLFPKMKTQVADQTRWF